MIAVLSPAKTLDFNPSDYKEYSLPRNLEASGVLVDKLKKKSVGSLQKLMGVSEKIALLNKERYQNFTPSFSLENAKQAGLAFKGDVYLGLEADTFTKTELKWADKHVRILSGLYGVLRPLDLIQPYRLEMGTPLENGRKKNLYEFWGNTITDIINEDLEKTKSKLLLNLASKEYFHSVKMDQLKVPVLNIHFRENRKGVYKVISFTAKKARGRMAHLMVKEKIKNPEALKELDVLGYEFNPGLSTEWDWHFTMG